MTICFLCFFHWTTYMPRTPMKTIEPESLTLGCKNFGSSKCSLFFRLFYCISQAKSTLQMNPPTVEKDKSIPSFATANAAAETAYRAAAAAAERLRSEDEGGSKPATNATNASWAQRPSSKAGTGNATKPSPKVFPERDGFNAGRARRSSPVNEGGWDWGLGGISMTMFLQHCVTEWISWFTHSVGQVVSFYFDHVLRPPFDSEACGKDTGWHWIQLTMSSSQKWMSENCSLSSNMSMMLQSVDIHNIYRWLQ